VPELDPPLELELLELELLPELELPLELEPLLEPELLLEPEPLLEPELLLELEPPLLAARNAASCMTHHPDAVCVESAL
jgi:hypothetical protein